MGCKTPVAQAANFYFYLPVEILSPADKPEWQTAYRTSRAQPPERD